jgi:four helix bundle protein
MDADDLKERTKQFALRCMRLADSLPNRPSGRTVANQLVRCGTSVAANYRAACRARSPQEFCAKMGIVEEEADESALWLELTIDAELKPKRLVEKLLQEADELTRITVRSIVTARTNMRSIKQRRPGK